MRKGFFVICSVLLVLVVSIAVSVPSSSCRRVPLDASIEFVGWSINGTLVSPGAHNVPRGTITDAQFKVSVLFGLIGKVVTIPLPSGLKIRYVSGEEESILLHAVNADGAVSMDPPATKVSQMTTVEGDPAPHGTEIELLKGEPVDLGVETVWELEIGTDYTKSINWLGIPSPEEILFDLEALPGQSYTLVACACVDLEGDENPENDCTGDSPPLTIIVEEE